MKTQQDLIQEVLKVEGGYVNDPKDSGGETNWGITVGTARSAGYLKDMKDMTREQAVDIYVNLYCKPLKIEQILKRSESLAHEILDTGVNMGVKRASKFFQRAVNCALRGKELTVDGILGRNSLAGLDKALRSNKYAVPVILKAMDSLQGAKYIELAESREKDYRFITGWLMNRVR